MSNNSEMQDMVQEDYVAPIFAILSGSFFIFGIAVTYLFWHRRDKFPIKGRLPKLGVFCSLSIVFWVCSVTLQRVWMIDTPCLVIIWILHAAFLPIFSFFFLRVWLLHFAYNATDQMLQTVKSGRSKDSSKQKDKKEEKKMDPTTEALKQLEPPNSNPRPRSGSNSSGSGNGSSGTVSLKQWYLINKHLTTDATMTKVFFATFAIEIAPAVVISIAAPSTYDRVIEHPCGTPYLASALVVCLIAILFVLFFLYISYKLSRFSDDGFSIKKELRFMGIFCPPAIVIWLLLTYVGPIGKVNDKIIGINAIWCWCCGVIVLSFINIYPIYLSYKMEQITAAFNAQSKAIVENSPEAQVSDLTKILKHPDGFESFQRYAMGEFSVENVLFWREAQYFRTVYADSSLSESYDQDEFSESEDHPVQEVVSGTQNTVLSESEEHSPTSPSGLVRTKSATMSDKTPRAASFRTSVSNDKAPTSPPSNTRPVPRVSSSPGARRSSESSSQSHNADPNPSLASAVPAAEPVEIHSVSNPVFGKTMVHKPTKSQRRRMASKEGTLKRLKKHHSAQIRGVGKSPLLHPDGVEQLSLIEAAKLIYDRFIADNAPLQVNLPSQVRTNVTLRLEAILRREAENQASTENLESPRLELRIPIPKDPVSPREYADQVAMLPLRTSSNPNIIPEDRSASDARSSVSVSANSATNAESTPAAGPAPFPNVLNVGPGFIGSGGGSPDGSSSRLLPPSPTASSLQLTTASVPRASPPTSPRKPRTLTEELEPLESDAHLFEEAQQSIFHLMQADIYGRYRTSDEFRELLTLLTDRKHEHELLREMEK